LLWLHKELEILREIESLLREAKDSLLMVEHESPCGCSPKIKVFKSPQAYQIAHRLKELEILRGKINTFADS
jgi:hypothetical protein